MNPNQKTPEPSISSEQLTDAIQADQRRGRWLTAAALSLGVFAIVVSFVIVCAYFFMVRPKQEQLLKNYGQIARGFSTGVNHADGTPGSADENARVQKSMQESQAMILIPYALGMGLAVVAASVGLLALGTLVTLTLTLHNRRVALRHINESLARISQDLKRLSGPQTS